MDIIDILGGLLRHKSDNSGNGPDILKDILKGKRQAPSKTTGDVDLTDAERSAKELEDLLNVTHERKETRRTQQPRQQSRQAPSRVPADTGITVDSPYAKPDDHQSSADRIPQNEQALVLVHAMVNAAKADGRITPEEQQNILKRFGNASPETTRFLREEFAKPLDVREFASSVPIGMEDQVYAMSLLAINVDTSAESAYLRDLSQCLRISTEVRDQLHQRYGIKQVR